MRLSDRPPWIIRTYAGFADAEATNERYRANLARGQRGLSVAFDLPTQNGYDSDHPMAAGEVGGTGVAVCHLGDMERLLDGIPLGEVNVSMTINATAPWLFALYLALAEKQGVAFEALRGTTQNDLMKEFVARGTYAFDPETSLRLSKDLVTYAVRHAPKWNPTNCCGYHYMESGASPAEEVGFAIGNAVLVLDAIRPELEDAQFRAVVERISFFVNSGIELVPEIAKFRAYARMWKRVCAELYGVEDVKFRAGCQVRSLTLTEASPEVNIVRIAYEALPAVLSASARVGALQLPGFREALQLPTESEQALSLRTQQVLMYETGISDHPDIFEGSKVVEGLTAEVLAEAWGIMEEMRGGGYASAIPWISRKLTEALVSWRARVDREEQVWLGVNAFTDPVGLVGAESSGRDGSDEAAVRRHLDRLGAWRNARNQAEVDRCLTGLKDALNSGENVLPASMALARAGGTTGEWSDVVERYCGGRYSAPLGTEGSGSTATIDVPKAERKVRIVLAKSGLDGHVNAVKLLAAACAQAGMEVIYTGIKQPPEAIVATALQEDADVVGISSLSGAHLHIASEVLRLLADRDASDVPVILGGIIPESDRQPLLDLGVKAVFTPSDARVGDVVARILEVAGVGTAAA
jgi:ethylmalonyl-CoA mutase